MYLPISSSMLKLFLLAANVHKKAESAKLPAVFLMFCWLIGLSACFG
jgi:hypothetical protein